MNKDSYGTREMCQKLHEAGLVVETDMAWKPYRYDASKKEYFDWRLTPTNQTVFQGQEGYPAPTLAEVWRELPNKSYLYKSDAFSEAWIGKGQSHIDKNPTDAACELLLWVKGADHE